MDKTEAIKILKDFHDESALFSVRTALETLHPELAMSEDEKIRKELIFYLGDMPEDTELRNGVTNRDVLVWLEKQGQPRIQYGITINGVDYELVEDQETDECERCALREICHNLDEVICNQLFGLYISKSHRFEKKTK